MICPKCGSNNIKVIVSVIGILPPEYIRKITEKTFKDNFKILGADWSKATVTCNDCMYSHTGV